MWDDAIFVMRFAAAIGCGLMAGLFFAFSTSVMHALGRIPPPAGMAAMQAINTAILNPVFLTVFLGTAVLCLSVAGVSVWRWAEAGALLCAIGAVLYFVGVFLVTIVVNVPMNNALASGTPDDPASLRRWAIYLARWTAWNHVRTIAALLAAMALTLGLATTTMNQR
jgi:uncharacterized membrane protein